jgi:HNH endonuclease
MSESLSRVMRRQVQQRAKHRCEYCLVHERDVWCAHEPDHIISEKHGGQMTLENLAWSCWDCNRRKSSDLASVDLETGRVIRLFHPRRDRWSVHFRLEDGWIIPLTAIGRVTEHFLQLNRDYAVASRRCPTTD